METREQAVARIKRVMSSSLSDALKLTSQVQRELAWRVYEVSTLALNVYQPIPADER